MPTKSHRYWVLMMSLTTMATAQMRGMGDLFVFAPGLGACGATNTDQQVVASVSSRVFKNFPNATANPNKNPICKHKILIQSEEKSVIASIVDFYVDMSVANVGLSPAGFSEMGDMADGIISGVTWSIR